MCRNYQPFLITFCDSYVDYYAATTEMSFVILVVKRDYLWASEEPKSPPLSRFSTLFATLSSF
jgi:hypothetical protein